MRTTLLVCGLLCATSGGASAQDAVLYGRTEGLLMPKPGTFMPAGTSWDCGAIDGRRCWDGEAWHEIYPAEPHRYAEKVPE